MLRVENAVHVRTCFTVIADSNPQQTLRVNVDRNFNRFAGGAATDSPGDEIEKRLGEQPLTPTRVRPRSVEKP